MQFGNDWDAIMAEEMGKDYYLDLRRLLLKEYAHQRIFPEAQNIFRAMRLTSFGDTKVVILGQDPYHGEGQAQGLSFSVPKGMKLPPSLVNIYKELEEDMGIKREDGDLTPWAKQGVLLLNTTLTVRSGQPLSHGKIGWEIFTDKVIQCIGNKKEPVVFILWGAHARGKKRLIHNKEHLILESPHPSPLSAYRGFFGCKCFSKTNDYLRKRGVAPIDWR
ncbi:uracil-DNA glycosylase [Aedoeadaptatus coxii]|uniref:Uracil-DNA glycosylase n=1 Tax=Aedoeadaptatus coxii TaxID=755172 RepID=A0A134AHV7_9FIRM|nr:uracil-DNA glycosylase [Peptoniphilus coxii]KXB67286.1 uracil-DNA glycosylase [Peptoniphilus coxii]CAC9934142.1 uracil-DNA glycosylase [Peptoniphilus coxii]